MTAIKSLIHEYAKRRGKSPQFQFFYRTLGDAVNETVVLSDRQEHFLSEFIIYGDIPNLSEPQIIEQAMQIATWINSCR